MESESAAFALTGSVVQDAAYKKQLGLRCSANDCGLSSEGQPIPNKWIIAQVMIERNRLRDRPSADPSQS
jgi:hypothetical protein